jgi:diacylglycerol kinase family enzyme
MRALSRLRVVVLLNTSAGTIERQGDTTLRQVLMSAFDKHGISAVMEFLPGAQLRSAAEQTRQRVVLGELDAIVVGGGDGSIRTVASALVGSDVPLGIIPLGTLNHFARDLRIPTLADRAVAVIASGEKRYLDVGEVNGRSSSTTHPSGSIRIWCSNASGEGAESGLQNGRPSHWPCRA